ncbi:hypothetical protein DFH05DRAFT_634793 [Lentinula detonsa]|uniref:Uncharacterized protein n=1 Tax=Lentinula detonsa TaxID=2804962 RepID=A0A9W8P8H9_9AGAR|nr:hypothetical protein DFH05DRAFT_634793 [Lentinula detonsa]
MLRQIGWMKMIHFQNRANFLNYSELYISPEPVLAPLSNFLVATCNFTITYFFPLWFQQRTRKHKMINTILETFPFIGTVLISQIHKNSGWIQSWFSIIPMGFWKRSSVTDHAYCTTCTYMVIFQNRT